MKQDLHDLSARTGTGQRCLLVVLALVVMLPVSAAASTKCGVHGPHAVVQAPGEVRDRWESSVPAGDDCPHCSPKHCAVAPACGATLAVVLTAPVENAAMIPLAPGIPVPDTRLPSGLDTQPPTPPPRVSA